MAHTPMLASAHIPETGTAAQRHEVWRRAKPYPAERGSLPALSISTGVTRRDGVSTGWRSRPATSGASMARSAPQLKDDETVVFAWFADESREREELVTF